MNRSKMNCMAEGMAVKLTKTGQFSAEPRTSLRPRICLKSTHKLLSLVFDKFKVRIYPMKMPEVTANWLKVPIPPRS